MGLIPAHAGKTPKMGRGRRPAPAHPRSRGENPLRWPLRDFDQGSSPLTRGKRSGRARSRLAGRLIPAHAGKTCRDPSRRPIHRAHPRSRGENLISSRRPAQLSGSSPLTRGKRDRPRRAQALWRLIPAHAGKTQERVRVGAVRTAHPRSRGENPVLQFGCTSCEGSSPLTRGKRPTRLSDIGDLRLIPAHAGKTHQATCQALRTRAHPRSRGENVARITTRGGIFGSSPLTRGKLDRGLTAPKVSGLIPAHAGKTMRRRDPAAQGSAHPRSRGENPGRLRRTRSTTGSSPLTRGKLSCRTAS